MYVMAALFLLIGLGLGYLGLRLRRATEAAAHWPEVEGKLERCEVVQRRSVKLTQPSTWGLGLEYSYRVGGRGYRSQRYAFVEPSTYDETEPQAIVDRLRGQEPLRVRYDPKNPKSAVLSAEGSGTVEGLALTCFVMAGVCILVTLVVCGAA